MFEVIRGGLLYTDPDEIPAPDKPTEEWTEEEKERYFLFCWEHAEESTVAYAVKKLETPAETIAAAIDVLEAVERACAAGSARTGLQNEFYKETCCNLLMCLRQKANEK